VNKSFEELIGVNEERLVGMNLSELNKLINYSRKQSNEIDCKDYIANEQFEASLTNVYGVKKEMIIHRSNILNIYGKPIGKISVITDVTELKDQQQKILHNEKLALLGQIGAVIVHETRNYLTTIKGCSQLISLTSDQDKIIEYAEKININTDEVNNIISNFLSLSKPKKSIREEVAVSDLVKSLQDTMETSSLIKGVDIHFSCNIDDRYILCDVAQIKQVMLNLCKNAIEAMSELTNPVLTVEAGISEENNYVYIKVSDSGKGMSKEILEKIGTPFFTTKQSGTGLGLSVCFELIKQHGGRIEVNSKEGFGTTFTINLPGLELEEESFYIESVLERV
jgi:PAS domain S-box-containing protein